MSVWALFTFTAICLATDLSKRKIYNPVILAGFLTALVINMVNMGARAGAVFTLKGFFIGLLLLLIPFMLGALGAGDAKMLAMIGAFVGSTQVLYVMLASGVAGGVYALIVMVKSGTLKTRMKKVLLGIYCSLFLRKAVHMDNLENTAATHQTIPYGAAITAGVIIIYILGTMGYSVSVASAAPF
jgi:prepilin peptidase CpaA